MEKTPMNVLIIGSYGANNLGDEALLEQLLLHISPKIKKSVLSGNISDTRKRHPQADCVALHFPFGLRSFFSFQWFHSFWLLLKADMVLFGGGGLLTDHQTVKAVALWTWQAFWVKMFRKPLVLVGNSVGPFRTHMGKILASWVLRHSKQVFLRDARSLELVRILAPKTRAHLGADLAFLSEVPKRQRSKMLALNLRPWKDKPDLSPLIRSYKKEGYQIKLIPMEPQDSSLLKNYVERGVELVNVKTYSELLELLSEAELAVGMRLHFLIAAALAGCKMAGISYSTKVEGMMELLDIPHFSMGSALKKASHVEDQALKAKEMLKMLKLS